MAGELPDDRHICVDLDTKVAALKQAATYPQDPGRIDIIETHMSWVFLTSRHAYKLKKPVRYEFLDFSTLAARQRNCEEELRLNRRLARGVYIAVVPLSVDVAGRLHLESPAGKVVEWLVKMRRLPADRMLDDLILRQALRATDLRPAARLLGEFYKQSAPIPIDGERYRVQLEYDIDYNRRELSRARYELDTGLVEATHTRQLELLTRMPALFDQRTSDGRIIEGHGDLRPEHICLEPTPVIFDCLEFNRQFRLVDPADELAFLAMECERLGAEFVGREFFRVYRQVTGDEPPAALVQFYKAVRACLRARLAIWHTHELERSAWRKWRDRANVYLRLAAGYTPCAHPNPPLPARGRKNAREAAKKHSP